MLIPGSWNDFVWKIMKEENVDVDEAMRRASKRTTEWKKFHREHTVRKSRRKRKGTQATRKRKTRKANKK